MAFSLTVHHGPYLLLVATGEAMVCDVLGMLDMAAQAAKHQKYTRAMFDLMAVKIDFSFSDHVMIGMRAAEVLKGMERVATVVNTDFRVGTSERAAQKDGLALQTFTDLTQASEWLAS